ncbi:MAG: hypothetical protein ACOYZ6_07865 [Chloroflexota bacterium]
MYKAHPKLAPPSDEATTIWRYMAFAKFVNMLDTSSLWFARADQFDDTFEGSSPKINVEARQPPYDLPREDIAVFNSLMKNTASVKESWVKHVAINCWHMNVTESTAMWELYLPPTKDGLAIQSTYRNIRDSLRTDESVYIGQVLYIDYEHQVIEGDSVLAPFIHKRKAFEHERELRAIIVRSPPPSQKGLDFRIETIQKGIPVPVDLRVLIQRVYIAPQAPIGLVENVRSLLEKYGYKFDITISGLSEKPFF